MRLRGEPSTSAAGKVKAAWERLLDIKREFWEAYCREVRPFRGVRKKWLEGEARPFKGQLVICLEHDLNPGRKLASWTNRGIWIEKPGRKPERCKSSAEDACYDETCEHWHPFLEKNKRGRD